MKKLMKEWKKPILILLLILGVGLFLRVYNLTLLPIFADEAIYVRWAQVMRVESTLRFLPLSDGKQPLFMWSVIPLLKVFNDPLLAGRFLSALTGLTSAVGIFFATYLLFDSKKTGLIASLIYALSPFTLFFDRMALVDSMLTMFGIFTFLGLILIAKTKRLDVAMLTGLALGGAFLTKSPALFFALLIPASLLIVDWPKKNKKRLLVLGKMAGLWAVVLVIAYGMYNILRLGPNFHLLSQRNLDYVYPVSHILQNPLDPFRPFIHRIYQYFWIMGPSVLIFISALGAFVNFAKKRAEVLLTIAWGLFPILVVAEFSKTMTARYVLFAVPYFMILAASAYLAKKELLRKVFVVGLIVFIIHALSFNYHLLTEFEKAPLPRSERSGYLEEWTAGVGIREIADYIKDVRDANPDEKILVGTEGYFGTLPDGLQIYLEREERINTLGIGLELDHVSEQLIESKRSGNKTYLVANSSRLYMNPRDVGLKVIAAYPKAVQPDGSRETLLLFEVTEEAVEISSEPSS